MYICLLFIEGFVSYDIHFEEAKLLPNASKFSPISNNKYLKFESTSQTQNSKRSYLWFYYHT